MASGIIIDVKQGAKTYSVTVNGGRMACTCSGAAGWKRCAHKMAVAEMMKDGRPRSGVVRDGKNTSIVRVNIAAMAAAAAQAASANLSTRLAQVNAVNLVEKYKRKKADPVKTAAKDAARRISLGERAERVIEEAIRQFTGSDYSSATTPALLGDMSLRGVRTIILEDE